MCELTPLCGTSFFCKEMFGGKGELLLLFSQEEIARVGNADNRNSCKEGGREEGCREGNV